MAALLVVALAQPAYADDHEDDLPFVIIPGECAQFMAIPGGTSSPAGWDQMLSFAACIQDASVDRVDRAEALPDFVDELQASLEPPLELYITAVRQGPDRIKVRAAYAIAAGQVALMTRARASLTNPALRNQLEELLEQHAEVAYMVFTTIERAAANPEFMDNAVDRYIVRSSHEKAALLEKRRPKRNGEIKSAGLAPIRHGVRSGP